MRGQVTPTPGGQETGGPGTYFQFLKVIFVLEMNKTRYIASDETCILLQENKLYSNKRQDSMEKTLSVKTD